jgi:lipopolysaccharide/colanic/teichoic acid biosynthesis glycosyltransferase
LVSISAPPYQQSGVAGAATRHWPTTPQQWDAIVLAAAHPWLRPSLTTRHASPSRTYRLVKRAVDVIVSATALTLMAPVLLVLMLAVKLEEPRVPVLFRQHRTGLGGRSFQMVKLRSMRPASGADPGLDASLPPGPKNTTHPRVTRLGRLLRRTSLDELPQLLNVLRGDMSVVGPRPTSLPADAHVLWQTERLEVRPGLTGLWQIIARGAVSFPDRCRLDIAYARRPSLLLDCRILLRSVPAVLSGRGAR